MNPIIASNSSSSLLSTISSSAAVMENPYVYSQTSNVAEFTSTQWVKTSPQSFTPGQSNSTLHYDIAKMGLVGRCILNIPWKASDNATDGGTDLLCPNFPIHAIQEITLSSQGRVISRLNRSSLIARMAERPSYTREGVQDAMGLSRTSTTTATAFPSVGGVALKGIYDSFLSLDFAFNDNQYALDTLFLQSVRISVTLGNLDALGQTAAFVAHACLSYNEPVLYIQYKNQNQMASDSLVSANYSSGLLSSILPTNVSESTKSFGMDATVGVNNELVMELKETSCIENIYVFCMIDPSSRPATAAAWNSETCVPLYIDGNITFSSNGQNWVDMPARLIGCFGYDNQKGRNAYDSCPIMSNGNNTSPLGYVYSLNFGQGGLCSDKVGGLISMRELSNPRITVNIASTAQTKSLNCTLNVCYNSRQLSTVVASSGMINIALSN